MTRFFPNGLRRIARLAALAGVLAVTGPAAAQQTLLLYGDSLMAGLGLAQPDGFAARLQAELGPDVTVLNASVSGDTSADGLARLDWSLAERPDAVVLELGANDMLQGLPVDAMRANLGAILQRLADDGIPVLLVGMRASPGLGAAYATAYDASFGELATQFDIPLYPFFLAGVALDSALNQPDGMHPNARGVARMVDGIAPAIKALLAEAESQSTAD